MKVEELKAYELDGKDFRSLKQFYEVFGCVVLNNYICPNLNAFNDVLRGGFGTPDEGFIIIWNNSSISQKALGADDYWAIVNMIKRHGPDGLKESDNVHLELK